MATEEAKVERYLHDQVKKIGGTTRKWVSPGRNGVPDRIVIMPDGFGHEAYVCFVEVKTLWGNLSQRQEREIKELRSLGCNVSVVHGKEDVDNFICRLKLKLGF